MARTRIGSGTVCLEELGPGVFGCIAEHIGANAGFVVGSAAVALVDTQLTPTTTMEVLRAIRWVTSRPVRFVVNTHHHSDHVFGNQYFVPEALIVAHERAAERIAQAAAEAPQRAATTWPALAEDFAEVRITPPAVTFSERLAIDLGGRLVQLLYLGRAHTDGDVYVLVPDARVLYCGDVFFNRVVPAMFDGYFRDWSARLETLAGLPAEGFVPGHGAVGTRDDLGVARGFLESLVAQVKAAHAVGLGEEEICERLDLAPYADWPRQQAIPRGVHRILQELRGEL